MQQHDASNEVQTENMGMDRMISTAASVVETDGVGKGKPRRPREGVVARDGCMAAHKDLQTVKKMRSRS